MKFNAEAIAEATGGSVLRGACVGAVLTDTRKLKRGCWFLALRGEHFDGHDYLAQAQAAGAGGCVVSVEPGPEWAGAVVLVPETTRALQDLGAAARDRLEGPVVALTGSSGKTTTRALIAMALQQLGWVHQTQGNLNNHLGVPMTLLAAPTAADVVVVEMGTSSPGEIAVLDRIARPNIRLVVNVGPAHLEELGGLAGVAREKGMLLRGARPGDTVCINLDDTLLCKLSTPEHATRISWGMREESTVRLVEAEVDAALATEATYETPMGTVHARIPAPGIHIAHDAGAALAVAWALGLDLHRSALDLGRYKPVGMRMKVQPLRNGAVALNDAYNANPSSMQASLQVLAGMSGRRVAVLGDMLELGTEADAWHRRVAEIAGALDLELVVLVGPIMSGAASACQGPAVWSSIDPMDVVEPLRAWLSAGDHVLFKGSRGVRVERVLQSLEAES